MQSAGYTLLRGADELLSLLDVLLQLRQACLDELLLLSREVSETIDGLDTFRAELNVGREEINALRFEEWAFDESGGNNALLAIESPQELVGELGSGVGHAESSTACTVLSLDDFITTELDPVHKSGVLFALDGFAWSNLREKGNDGSSAVSTNHGNVALCGSGAGYFRQEARGADDIESGDTEEALGVEFTGLFEDGSNNGDGGVDGVRDDKDVSLGRDTSDSSGEVSDDGSISIKEIITGHARLSRDTSRNDDNFDSLESLIQLVCGIAFDLAGGINMANISSNTRCATNIIQAQAGDELVLLEQQR